MSCGRVGDCCPGRHPVALAAACIRAGRTRARHSLRASRRAGRFLHAFSPSLGFHDLSRRFSRAKVWDLWRRGDRRGRRCRVRRHHDGL
jgi:hypothetical protein